MLVIPLVKNKKARTKIPKKEGTPKKRKTIVNHNRKLRKVIKNILDETIAVLSEKEWQAWATQRRESGAYELELRKISYALNPSCRSPGF